MLENSEINSKNYKQLAKIYKAAHVYTNKKYISKLIEEYDIDYRLPENSILKLCNPELISLSALDCLIKEKDCFWAPMCEIMDVLLDKGANFTNKNNKGMTILHRIIYNSSILYPESWFSDSQLKNRMINNILNAHVKTNNVTNPSDENGITHFYVACMADHVEAVEFFLNNGISSNEVVQLHSPEHPGYTPLHFAVRYYSFEVADVLLKRGADPRIKNAKGMSPLHVLINLSIGSNNRLNTVMQNESYRKGFYIIEKIIRLFLDNENEDLQANYTDNLAFSLLHAACAMSDVSMVKYYLDKGYDINHAVNIDSPICPGYTALHFAAHFKSNAFKLLFDNGGNIEAKDSKGITPFDIFVQRSSIENIHAILKSHAIWKSIVLSDGNTKLINLVWAMREVNNLEDFLDLTNINVNVTVPLESPLWPGYTALHLAIILSETLEIECRGGNANFEVDPKRVVMYMDKIKLLIRRGADVNVEDLDGLSPWKLANQLKRKKVTSYLTEMYPGILDHTPVSVDKPIDFWELRSTLTIPEDEYHSPLYRLKTDVDLQRRVQHDLGVTMLHVACWQLDIDWVKDLLDTVNVNAQTHSDLPLWAGCSPLNLLMMKSTLNSENGDRIDVILQLLLNKGADIMLANVKNYTSLHATEAKEYLIRVQYYDNPRSYANSPYTALLLNRLEDFKINPINKHGISHFHIACIRNDVRIIEKFLEHGVDVNEPVYLFSKKYAGCSPLHLAMVPGPFTNDSSRERTIDLLMSREAELFTDDSEGNTLLHAAAKSNQPREGLLEKLLCLGLDINSKNTVGDTPLELLLQSKDFTIKELEVFTKRGCQLHSFNPINKKGYLTKILNRLSFEEDDIVDKQENFFKALPGILKINELDDLNRTIIHNIVSDNEGAISETLIDYLIEQGCDVDHQDNLGRTALHIASEFLNYCHTKTLLAVGADINIVDKNGNSVFACCLKSFEKLKPFLDDYINNEIESDERLNCIFILSLIDLFRKHIQMMQFCGMYVSDHIAKTEMISLKVNLYKDWYENDDIAKEESENLYKQIEKTKGMKFGNLLITLYDFLSESRAMKVCRSSSSEAYDVINEFFSDDESQIHKEVDKVIYIAKRLYKKTLTRLSLIEIATSALSILLGFPIPHLCSEFILSFLSNRDLENLVASTK